MITPQHTNIMTGPHTWSLSAYCCLEGSVSWHVLFYESFIFCRIAVRYNAHLTPRATIIVTCFTLSQMHDMHLVTRSSLSATVYLMIHYTSLQTDDSWNITASPSIHRWGTPREKWLESKLSVLNNSHASSSTHNSGDGQTVAGCLNRDMLQPCISSRPSDPLHRENKMSVFHFDGTRGIILEHLVFLPSRLFPLGNQNKQKKENRQHFAASVNAAA